MSVVVRFAPSPTGVLHIGSVRTALFNWLFARGCGGKFLLRIEDTDKLRSTSENTARILDILKWLEIDWDDDVVMQSSRIERHRQVALDLVDSGNAYFCYCSQEELAAKKEAAIQRGESYKYDRTCRDKKKADGVNPVVRLKSRIDGTTKVDDVVQGEVVVDNSQLDDLVLLRSDGTPTYMLSVVVDDHDMGITHVIRGDDHLTNTFRQIQIYEACGWEIPKFGHIPLIYGPDGTKLSKRHGAASAQDYIDLGYLPEAICNYLLRLGWSHGDSEIIPRSDALEWFSLDNVGKSPSRFDMGKLQSLNAHYLRKMDNERLLDLIVPFMKQPLSDIQKSMIVRGMNGLKDRSKTLVELADSAVIYVKTPDEYDEQCGKYATERHLKLLSMVTDVISRYDGDISEESLLNDAKKIAEDESVKLVEIAQALRGALCGKLVSPSVFEVISIIGADEAISKINAYIKYFGSG
jgi:glutamyl-tRNA synthetase